MLKQMVMSPRNSNHSYIAVADLARSMNIDYDVIYSYIRRNHYKRYKLKTTGRTIYVSSATADEINYDFTHAEELAIEVPED